MLTGGSFPDVMGCIFCDGQFRVMGPGIGGLFTGSLAEGLNRLGVPLPAGTLSNLKVYQSSPDPGTGRFQYFIIIQGSGSGGLGCPGTGITGPSETSCVSPPGAMTIGEGTRIALGVANDPSTGIGLGGFYVKWSVEFEPAP